MKAAVFFLLFAGMVMPLPVAAQMVQNPKLAAGAYIVKWILTDEASGTGPLHIIYSDGTDLTVADERGDFTKGNGPITQESFSDIQLAQDHRTIGWLAEYRMCAQSYPCPLELIIYRAGHVLQKISPAYGIFWSWKFLKGGREVAARSGFSHGDDTGEYELYDIGTGRKLAGYSLRGRIPGWAR